MNGRECDLCGREMTVFASQERKVILMCPCCGSVYLPKETRNKRVSDYKYSYGGTFLPSGDMPTQKQISYIKVLCNQLNLEEVDAYSMTKEEARILISELKEKADEGYYTIGWHKIKIEEETDGEYIILNNRATIEKKWLKEYKNKLHPADDWTNVNLETYVKNIINFDIDEMTTLLNLAKSIGVFKMLK